MQCPSQFYEEQENSDYSCSDDDFGACDEPSYPCCEYLLKSQLSNLRSKRLEAEKQINCLCSKCVQRNNPEPKVRGKFGIAYVVQTPKDMLCKPVGWQVEFQDTPSQIDHNCQKMVKWVTCSPLGECSNVETKFLYCPEVSEELLNDGRKKCCCRKKSIEKCCIIEVPKVACRPSEQVKSSYCIYQPKYPCSPNRQQNKTCLCSRNKHGCLSMMNNCTCLEKQFQKFMMCKKCCNNVANCTCFQTVQNTCCREPKKLRCKCQTSPRCPFRTIPPNISNHCHNSRSYYCTIEEHICTSCGKVMEKNCYVKEKNTCDDALDYIPDRDICLQAKCKGSKDCNSLKPIKSNEAKETVYEIKRDKSSSTDRTPRAILSKTPPSQNKVSNVDNTKSLGESKSPRENGNLMDKSNSKKEIKEEPTSETEVELDSQDLTKEKEEKKESKHEKKFTTKGDDPNQPSLLDRIKKAHHKQAHEIHPEIPETL